MRAIFVMLSAGMDGTASCDNATRLLAAPRNIYRIASGVGAEPRVILKTSFGASLPYTK